MPLYCYENSSELEVPLKRSWRLQGLWTILENRCHLLLSRSTGGHWILNKLPTELSAGVKTAPSGKNATSKRGTGGLKPKCQPGWAGAGGGSGPGPHDSVGIVASRRAHSLSQGQQLLLRPGKSDYVGMQAKAASYFSREIRNLE